MKETKEENLAGFPADQLWVGKHGCQSQPAQVAQRLDCAA